MIIRILFTLSLLISTTILAQNDSLNRFDANGRRTGWWIVYLDKDLGEVKDSAAAVYYRYTVYQGKFNYYSMGRIGTKKCPVMHMEEKLHQSNGPRPLEGEFTANYKNGSIRFILLAENGKLTHYKEFYKNGSLKTHFDYTRSCGHTPLHYCIFTYKKDGSLKYKGTIQNP